MPEISDNAVEARMTSLCEASTLLKELAAPGQNLKASRLDVWRKISAFASRHDWESWSFNRVVDVWRCDPRVRVSADELNLLRAMREARNTEKVRNELKELRSVQNRLATIEARLLQIDPDFFGAAADSLRAARGELE